MVQKKPINIQTLRKMKQDGEKIAMITAYDYPSAKLAEQAGADILLVGDSLGMVVLGYESTLPVTVDDMVHHTKAVTRAASRSFVVTDLPFLSYHGSLDTTFKHAGKVMQQGLAKALKLEGGQEIAGTVKALVDAGVPVMGHLGLTPQSVNQLGGYRVQGKDSKQAKKLLEDALAIEAAGAFSIVLEMVPEELAQWITSKLSIPTIGIGAGKHCDGQVLVYHDMLRYASPIKPKFVKQYADVESVMISGMSSYVQEVKNGQFPADEHVFHMDEQVLRELTETSEA